MYQLKIATMCEWLDKKSIIQIGMTTPQCQWCSNIYFFNEINPKEEKKN